MTYEREGKRTYWNCVCDCGGKIRIETNNLRRIGRNPSCGCLSREITSATNSTHRMTGTRVYRSWSNMKRRCYVPTCADYIRYGGKGVTVCDEWVHSFEAFFNDMGNPPTSRHTLDRFPDPYGNYEPKNCRWATYKQQANNFREKVPGIHGGNVRHEFNGLLLTLPEWAERLNIPEVTIRKRLQAGRPIDQALSQVNLRYGSQLQSRK